LRASGPDDLRALSDSFNHMAASLEQSDSERRNIWQILRMNYARR